MVLADDVHNGLSQLVLPRQFNSLLNMGDQDETTHRRRQLLMAIFAIELVFYEIQRLLELPGIMVVG